MEHWKIERWTESHFGRPFPDWRHLSQPESNELRSRLLARLGLPPATESLALLEWLEQRAVVLEGADAKAADFRLYDILVSSGVQPRSSVYLNWHQFDDVDVVSTEQLSTYFDDIWFPSSDDLDVFDASLDWLLMIFHYGVVALVRVP